MELWQALLLGIVEGLTEYLPVSSTGHLLVTQRILGIPESDASNAYAIAIQAGAIVAVLALYRKRVGQMALGAIGRDPIGAKLAMCVIVAFLPAAIVGFALDDLIESVLFGPWPIVVAWVVGGVVILWFARTKRSQEGRSLEELGWRAALAIGAVQCIAMWPGVSRSLATILGGVAVGLSLSAAVEFSFLLGLVTLGAATAYKSLQHGATMLEAYGPLPVAIGFVAAWIAAVVSVRFMVGWLNERGLGIFAWWRFGAAAIVVAMIAAGML
ncbi:undecaprenyl-diphosphate phosphatase [Sandaracinus amylolyticus]|uniref:Undecaprenyl-diphosphatase n=1 Tax=Sandaracinus amylolyticus TaxID=927083 RepID=A0A0F6YIJ1_9BACT|nr:undecaprenyl-diphosphate phosphatase [Sandaracinus amylolyticus]AKF05978.1 Undecaprenyl-diphosphatase [Sandaracinus amylolyticus]